MVLSELAVMLITELPARNLVVCTLAGLHLALDVWRYTYCTIAYGTTRMARMNGTIRIAFCVDWLVGHLID